MSYYSTGGKSRRGKLDAAEKNHQPLIDSDKVTRTLLFRGAISLGWDLCEERLREVLVELLNQEKE